MLVNRTPGYRIVIRLPIRITGVVVVIGRVVDFRHSPRRVPGSLSYLLGNLAHGLAASTLTLPVSVIRLDGYRDSLPIFVQPVLWMGPD